MKGIFWTTVGAAIGGCALMWMGAIHALIGGQVTDGFVLWLLGFVAATISGFALIAVDWTKK